MVDLNEGKCLYFSQLEQSNAWHLNYGLQAVRYQQGKLSQIAVKVSAVFKGRI